LVLRRGAPTCDDIRDQEETKTELNGGIKLSVITKNQARIPGRVSSGGTGCAGCRCSPRQLGSLAELRPVPIPILFPLNKPLRQHKIQTLQ
jgi:hypothetical protein